MSISATIMATWGASFVVALINGKALGPTGITWLAIAALEIVIVSPIEEYLTRKSASRA